MSSLKTVLLSALIILAVVQAANAFQQAPATENRVFQPMPGSAGSAHDSNHSLPVVHASTSVTAALGAYYLLQRKRKARATPKSMSIGEAITNFMGTKIIQPAWNFLNTDVDITSLWRAVKLSMNILPFSPYFAEYVRNKFVDAMFRRGVVSKEYYENYTRYSRLSASTRNSFYDGLGYWVLGVNKNPKTGKTTIKVYDILLDLLLIPGAAAKVAGVIAKGLGFLGKATKIAKVAEWLSRSGRAAKSSRVLGRLFKHAGKLDDILRAAKTAFKSRRPVATAMRWLRRITKGRPFWSKKVSKLNRLIKDAGRFVSDLLKARVSVTREGLSIGYVKGFAPGKWLPKIANYVKSAEKYRLFGIDLWHSHLPIPHVHIGPIDTFLKSRYVGGALSRIPGKIFTLAKLLVEHPINPWTAALISRGYKARHHIIRSVKHVYKKLRKMTRRVVRRHFHRTGRVFRRNYHNARRRAARLLKRAGRHAHRILRRLRRIRRKASRFVKRTFRRFFHRRRLRHYSRRRSSRVGRVFRRNYHRIRRHVQGISRRVRRVVRRTFRRVGRAVRGAGRHMRRMVRRSRHWLRRVTRRHRSRRHRSRRRYHRRHYSRRRHRRSRRHHSRPRHYHGRRSHHHSHRSRHRSFFHRVFRRIRRVFHRRSHHRSHRRYHRHRSRRRR